MTIEEIREKLKTPEYEFLQKDKHLGRNLILLGLGGSYSYGMNIEGKSDVDIRGVALNSKEEILLGQNFGQVVEENTDTTIYSFNKMIELLCSSNPNVIEQMGLKPEHYLYIHPVGQELLDHSDLFLSKIAVHSFGGYANSQLRRLDNKSARSLGQKQQEEHILHSIENAFYTFPQKYFTFRDESIRLYIDDSEREGYDSEIFMDVNLKHYPLRDYKGMWAEMNNIVKDYSKLGKRNRHAIVHDKIGKHMAHLIRLYYMCFDILENQKIVTYREKEHDLLMDLRNGKYLDENQQPISAFYDLLSQLEKRMEYDEKNTSLPEKPDYKKINEFRMEVNERIVTGKYEEENISSIK